jgi:hypothetical protein
LIGSHTISDPTKPTSGNARAKCNLYARTLSKLKFLLKTVGGFTKTNQAVAEQFTSQARREISTTYLGKMNKHNDTGSVPRKSDEFLQML